MVLYSSTLLSLCMYCHRAVRGAWRGVSPLHSGGSRIGFLLPRSLTWFYVSHVPSTPAVLAGMTFWVRCSPTYYAAFARAVCRLGLAFILLFSASCGRGGRRTPRRWRCNMRQRCWPPFRYAAAVRLAAPFARDRRRRAAPRLLLPLAGDGYDAGLALPPCN